MKPKKRTKRPPRVMWFVFDEEGKVRGSCTTRRDAQTHARLGDRVVGPYVLAERVRER